MPAPTDPRVDAYIARAPEFARPILTRVRAAIRAACPEAVETIKWSTPFYDHHGPMCSMAAFTAHCALRFWKGALVLPEGQQTEKALGPFGHLESVKDLPSPRALAAMVKKAAALNEGGVTAPWMEARREKAAARAATPVVVPDDLAAALKKNRAAKAAFDAFSPSHRREYIAWITGAKRDETRARRLATTLAQLEDGKTVNWRYETDNGRPASKTAQRTTPVRRPAGSGTAGAPSHRRPAR